MVITIRTVNTGLAKIVICKREELWKVQMYFEEEKMSTSPTFQVESKDLKEKAETSRRKKT